ncbi:hypothetical protein [uncultured Desulfuromusa sp.]|uniref:hypothetical protein n=1 Tax=uncultured Desulfuromusa sp. TaxID=219183 RepID=UPI002AA641F7|nr:hypothetical protein [uncultured Desulfuromusa sp.]
MAQWPATIPQKPRQSDYSAADVEATIRTSMDAGPEKVRRRYTAVPELLTCVFVMTIDEHTTFQTFFRETIARGALPFDWIHPETGVAVVCRIIGVPTRRYRGPLRYAVSMQIEVLP